MAGGAVGPPRLDLGDHEIGSQSFHEAVVWNTETIEANVTSRVEGHPVFQLVSAPSRIWPSREGIDPNNKFRVVFSPTTKGRVSGALRVNLRWRNDAYAPVELLIPIEGVAHATGAPSLAEEAADQRADLDAERQRADQAAAAKKQQDADDRRWNEHKQHGNGADRAELARATTNAGRIRRKPDHFDPFRRFRA
jgi:hypothetical protein